MATQLFGGIKSDNTDFEFDTVNRVFTHRDVSTRTKINAKKHGATGDGATDDTAAITAVLNAAIANNSECYIPAGTYMVTDGVLSSLTATNETGLRVYGDGIGATILKMAEAGGWFYDNGDSTPKLERPTFRDIQFEGYSNAEGVAELCGGFKIWSSGHEKDFKFIRCRFKDVNQVIHSWGDANGDHFGCLFCDFSNIRGDVIYLNNSQAVAHTFVGCTHYGPGDIVHIGKGGCIHFVGGSYNLLGTAGLAYVVHCPSGGSVGAGNDGVVFDGVRIELGTADKKLVRTEKTGLRMIDFNNCNMFTSTGADKEVVYIKDDGHVTFRNCRMSSSWNYKIDDDALSYTYANPLILFDGCALPPDISERITVTTNCGRVRAVNTVSSSPTPSPPPYNTSRALDFDYNWRNGPAAPCSSNSFKATFKATLHAWPNGTGNDFTLYLPRTIKGGGCRLKSVHLFKPAEENSVNKVIYKLGTQDKSTVYAQTKEDYVKNDIELHAEVGVELADADRDLLLWAETSDTNAYTSGYAYVEYD